MATPSPSPIPSDPLWYKDAIIYQLHVKSFFDANNDGVGDFAGLIAKLDYIAGLGVDTIWLLPFYPSPLKDDGYDISEYREVNPSYGSMADVRRFIKEAHARGLRVITELVVNHTSDQHPWFQRARHAKPGSNARNYYVWSQDEKKFDGTRIIFVDTEKSNWTWDPVAQAYFWHRFYSHQPDLNFDNPQVLKAVIGVMNFWLDMGVDGLRLDAVPYLIEREGTNNENLAETHAVLKKIRAALDASYKDRLLLAEANQWPEDTQEYFGRGDECHMAFHFPLMPRMYMAIAQEDRFPIVDILRQTPEIPESCQWAIFLRNHDELTLEMVTDIERDYLWKFYAADRRARINLGIRRRLAPLLEGDRRRMELMNGLLLSMPGTPVVYYGDEIGMGDNIHLGDRDGVRTPMQWSPDRNGGFSYADYSTLILPPIIDPLYGFSTVNVEAQTRNPHSMLNWMRRMLQLRRNHRAFGRGTLRFIYATNRKVLAYLREHEGETILCVANVSRSAQAVELDLSGFADRVPVEMTGSSAFPPIGQLPYLLTLPPYGFYWFLLRSSAEAPAWRLVPPEQMPEFLTLVVRHNMRELLETRHLTTVTRDILPNYLPRRRWFALKNENLEDVRIAYSAPLHDGEARLAEVEARTDGRTERYFLPLAIAWEELGMPPLPQQLALARVRWGRRVGFLTDGFAVDTVTDAILKALRARTVTETPEGNIHFEPAPALDATPTGSPSTIQRISGEQSNSSLIADNKVMLKFVRRVLPGIHPEVEMTSHLTRVGYTHSAPFLGEVSRHTADGTSHTLLIAQGNLQNQGNAWTWLVDRLGRAAEEFSLTGDDASLPGIVSVPVEFLATIGRRLGELHALLAKDSDDPAFDPESAGDDTVKDWSVAARNDVSQALDALRKMKGQSDATLDPIIAQLVARESDLAEGIGHLASYAKNTLKIRVHGDFHLGQVLVSKDDAYIIDFEGEPARSLDERRAKTNALVDVAGLLRSIDYAAESVARAENEIRPPEVHERRHRLLKRFKSDLSTGFLAAYDAAVAAQPRLALAAPVRQALLDFFLLKKAAYEIRYEAAHRPKWLAIPLLGFDALVGKFLPGWSRKSG